MREIFRAPLEILGSLGAPAKPRSTNGVALSSAVFIYGLFGLLFAASGGYAVWSNEWSWHWAEGFAMLVIGVGLLLHVAISVVRFFRAQGDQK